MFLAAKSGKDTVTLVPDLSRDLVDAGHNVGNWIRDVAIIVGGSGDGKPDLAQAGGKQPDKLPEALDAARTHLRARLR